MLVKISRKYVLRFCALGVDGCDQVVVCYCNVVNLAFYRRKGFDFSSRVRHWKGEEGENEGVHRGINTDHKQMYVPLSLAYKKLPALTT